MKCPICSENAMTFGRSLIIIDSRSIQCNNCKSQLRLTRKWISAFWVSACSAFLFGALYALANFYINPQDAKLFLIGWIVAAFIYSIIFWKYATYEVSQEKADTTPAQLHSS